MGWSRVSDTSQVVTPGEEITVKVLRVDDDKQKISLGLKQLTADPWSSVHRHLRGRPGVHRPRDTNRGVRGVRRARAGGRSVGARVHVCADGAIRGMVSPGRSGDDGGIRDPEHRPREEADRRRARSRGLSARRRDATIAGGLDLDEAEEGREPPNARTMWWRRGSDRSPTSSAAHSSRGRSR